MVSTQHPQPIRQHRLVGLNGFLHPPRLPQRPSEIATNCQRIGVIRTQHPLTPSDQQAIFRDRLTQPTIPPKRCSQVASSCKHIFMIKAKFLFHTAKKFTTHINRRTGAFIAHQGRYP